LSDHPIRFDGEVAIVTGAGGGMGRAYAIELARRGAKVLVNDYGGDMFGQGASAGPAETVAAEIRAAGGVAIANGDAVGSADAARAIVAAALDAYGRIDILINNAGVSAPGPIDGSTDDKVEAVLATNLLGPIHLTRAVWPAMTAQGHGRILNISSNACLGKGRSAPYAASKAGLLGLTMDTAFEGAGLGIKANALMPTAYSRMIDAVPDKAFVAWMREHMPAERVVAAAIYLVSRRSTVTGRIFSVGGGRLARLAFMASPGLFDAALTAEAVENGIEAAMAMDGAVLVESHADDVALYRIGDISAGPPHDAAGGR
jgi:NAD(P)-dependent dehydrogenase (short-subunit alcohol dehydrogenase family)